MRELIVDNVYFEITEAKAEVLLNSGAIEYNDSFQALVLRHTHSFTVGEVEILLNMGE